MNLCGYVRMCLCLYLPSSSTTDKMRYKFIVKERSISLKSEISFTKT